MKKILVFTAHPDDNAFIAGTYLKLSKLGWEITEVVMTQGEGGLNKSSINKTLASIRSKEVKDFGKKTGIKKVIQLKFSDGRVEKDALKEEEIIKYLRKYEPSIVITHHNLDYHIDHIATYQIVKRCLEKATRKYLPELGPKLNQPILLTFDGYNLLPNPDLQCDTSKFHDIKMETLAESYGSQLSHKLYNFIDYQNKIRGSRVNIEAAESYKTGKYRNFKYTQDNTKVFAKLVKDFLNP